MKTLLIALLLTGTAFANNIPAANICSEVARYATIDFDWMSYEDDYNEAVVTSKSFANGHAIYSIRAGYELQNNNSDNSTYKVTVQIEDNQQYGIGAAISCEVVDIEETRTR